MLPCNQMASTETPLCSTHYRQLYRHINPTSYIHTCKLCGKGVQGVAKTQKCPDPKLIQDYLLKHCEFNGTIDVDDKICLSCYKSHFVIVNQVQQNPVSTECDLQHILHNIRDNI